MEDALYHKTQRSYNQTQYFVYIPKSLVPSVLQHYHTTITNQKHVGKLQQTITTRPNEMVGINIMGPLPRSTQ